MKLNPLSEALLEKGIQKPDILTRASHVSFVEQSMSETPSEIIHFFDTLKNQPYLKLKPSSKNTTQPLRVGVVFSGGQAPGGHNVIWGLHDTLMQLNPSSELLGFLNGPSGFLQGKYEVITKKVLDKYRNLGGFNMIGSGRTKIETEEQLKQALKSAHDLKLDGFVIIGGDDSNTNAAVLAHYFKKHSCPTSVVGVPKTIDGDLQNEFIEISFGFDTACKLYSELIGNILTDILSSKKYYHFIKIMGRSASHIALECALQTHPNLVFIGEEVLAKKRRFKDLVDEITTLIVERSEKGKNYGLILIPEGLIDFVPSFKKLNSSLNAMLSKNEKMDAKTLKKQLPSDCLEFYSSLPENIQKQLLLDRDPHGNIQLAKIDTHKLLIDLVEKELAIKEKSGNFKGKFNPHSHYFGYEGRCANPSCFDAEYSYALGASATLLVAQKHTGYMACVKNLKHTAKKWDIYGLPIVSLLNMEQRHGKQKPVIKKALVDLMGPHFKYLEKQRGSWRLDDHYNAPGPIQFFAPDKITATRNFLLDTR